MSNNQNRRPSFSSSTMSSLAKRHGTSSSENSGKPSVTLAAPRLGKKRAPLSNITNQKKGSEVPDSSSSVHCSNKSAKIKVAPTQLVCLNVNPASTHLHSQRIFHQSSIVLDKNSSMSYRNESEPSTASIASNQREIKESSPIQSEDVSVSMDESMSPCDSFKSPQVEYIDINDVSAAASIERNALSNLHITENPETTGSFCRRDAVCEMAIDRDKLVNIDNNYEDPQLCATLACDIYKHLRASEAKKRPATDFMDRVQKDINATMRGILVDWLVEVAEEYRLVPDTLYLTVNYIDRYLSRNTINRQQLQLLGVTCMMIAAKYEEICAPQVEEFCYITDNTYFREEILEMESSVLKYLKFEMTAPTTKCFLRRFVRAAQGIAQAPWMHLDCMANYIAELSLLEYNMLSHSPSLTAAAVIFLAKFILNPTEKPWNSTLKHYTLYEASDLRNCVKDLLRLCCDAHSSTLPAVREKYSQHKYKFVAKKFCPPFIPPEFFHDN